MDSIYKKLCSLSATQIQCQNDLSEIKMNQIEKSVNQIKHKDLAKLFPLKTMEEYEELTEKLKDPSLSENLVSGDCSTREVVTSNCRHIVF